MICVLFLLLAKAEFFLRTIETVPKLYKVSNLMGEKFLQKVTTQKKTIKLETRVLQQMHVTHLFLFSFCSCVHWNVSKTGINKDEAFVISN